MTVSPVNAIQTAIQVTAHNVANSATPGFEPSRVIFQAGPAGQVQPHVEHPRHRQGDGSGDEDMPSGTDLPQELTDLAANKQFYNATLKSIRAQADSLGFLLDILA